MGCTMDSMGEGYSGDVVTIRSQLFGKSSKLRNSCYSRHIVLAVIGAADGEESEIAWAVWSFPDTTVVWVVRGVPDIIMCSCK